MLRSFLLTLTALIFSSCTTTHVIKGDDELTLKNQAPSHFEACVNKPILDTLNIAIPAFLKQGDTPRPLRLSGGFRVSKDGFNQFLNKDLAGSLEGAEFFLQYIMRSGIRVELFLGGPVYTIEMYEYQFEYGYLGGVLQYHLLHGHRISPYIGFGSVSFKESIGYTSPPITNIGGVNFFNLGCDVYANKILSVHIDLKRYGLPSYTYPDQVDQYDYRRLNRPSSLWVSNKIAMSLGVSLNANFWK